MRNFFLVFFLFFLFILSKADILSAAGKSFSKGVNSEEQVYTPAVIIDDFSGVALEKEVDEENNSAFKTILLLSYYTCSRCTKDSLAESKAINNSAFPLFLLHMNLRL
ncbi:MAG: hypothetical protein H0W61_14040 [Bacteroidetes bacterium]|nr:hypothetical protein [Bacteroidota bacterium]